MGEGVRWGFEYILFCSFDFGIMYMFYIFLKYKLNLENNF